MKVEILQEDLSKALSICGRFASSHTQLPVLANILLDAHNNKLVLSSTNLETSVNISLGAKVIDPGKITVPSKIIVEVIENIEKGNISLETEKETLVVKSSSFRSSITGMNASDFPNVSFDTDSNFISFTQQEFQSSFSKTIFSASTDETRPVLTGVLIITGESGVTFVSTDGFRLSKITLNKPVKGVPFSRIIIPKSTLSEAIRIASGDKILFSYKESDKLAFFSFGNISLSSRIIDGEFPDFERIIPKEGNIKVEVDKEDFVRTVKLASIFARDSGNIIKMSVSHNSLSIFSESNQYGTQNASLDAKVDGVNSEKKFNIAFNYQFITSFLNCVEGDTVRMEFSESNSPALFLDSKDSNFLHLIMPIKIQE
jgi:DNA polymerase-3 subunit beta